MQIISMKTHAGTKLFTLQTDHLVHYDSNLAVLLFLDLRF